MLSDKEKGRAQFSETAARVLDEIMRDPSDDEKVSSDFDAFLEPSLPDHFILADDCYFSFSGEKVFEYDGTVE